MRFLHLAIACVALLPAAAGAGPVRQLDFDVFLDDREIGDHSFRLRDVDGTVHVASSASFRVKAWFVTAFRYEHESAERWEGGCLRGIEAQTDSNGKRSSVSGAAEAGRFHVRSGKRDDSLEGCIRSFAYWDLGLLQAARLLDPQTGENLAVQLTPLPGGTLAIGGGEIAVDRYALKASGMDITLSYDSGTGEWVGLDSAMGKGRTLRYRRSPGELAR